MSGEQVAGGGRQAAAADRRAGCACTTCIPSAPPAPNIYRLEVSRHDNVCSNDVAHAHQDQAPAPEDGDKAGMRHGPSNVPSAQRARHTMAAPQRHPDPFITPKGTSKRLFRPGTGRRARAACRPGCRAAFSAPLQSQRPSIDAQSVSVQRRGHDRCWAAAARGGGGGTSGWFAAPLGFPCIRDLVNLLLVPKKSARGQWQAMRRPAWCTAPRTCVRRTTTAASRWCG